MIGIQIKICPLGSHVHDYYFPAPFGEHPPPFVFELNISKNGVSFYQTKDQNDRSGGGGGGGGGGTKYQPRLLPDQWLTITLSLA